MGKSRGFLIFLSGTMLVIFQSLDSSNLDEAGEKQTGGGCG